jgi:hypothetical protein
MSRGQSGQDSQLRRRSLQGMPRPPRPSADIPTTIRIVRRQRVPLDSDTRKQFDQVYEAILGLMATSPRKQ